MDDVHDRSNREMTYWQAWFHFWVKSFPGGIHTKDFLNPSFYYTERKRKLRVFIHTVVIVFFAILIGTLLSPVTGVTNANAQGNPPGSYGGPPVTYQLPANYGSHGGIPSSSYDPNNVGHHGYHAPDPCVLVYDGMIADGYNSREVYRNAYAAMAQCYAWQAQGDRGWWPDT